MVGLQVQFDPGAQWMSGAPGLSHHIAVILSSDVASFSGSSTQHDSRISILTSSQLKFQWERVPISYSKSSRIHPYWTNLVNTPPLTIAGGIWCVLIFLDEIRGLLPRTVVKPLWKSGALRLEKLWLQEGKLRGFPKERWNGSWADKSTICLLQSPKTHRKRLRNGACGAD